MTNPLQPDLGPYFYCTVRGGLADFEKEVGLGPVWPVTKQSSRLFALNDICLLHRFDDIYPIKDFRNRFGANIVHISSMLVALKLPTNFSSLQSFHSKLTQRPSWQNAHRLEELIVIMIVVMVTMIQLNVPEKQAEHSNSVEWHHQQSIRQAH